MNEVKQEYNYWFIKSKTMNGDDDGNIQTTFRLPKERGDRDHAKFYVINTWGNKPFSRPKKPVDDEINIEYYYLAKSDEYWYEYNNKVFQETCRNCNKEFERTGSGYKGKLWFVQGKPICSFECNVEYQHKLELERESMDNDNYFVDENDHVLIDQENKGDLCGYIYMITNQKTMTSYIGKTIKPPLFRWWQHLKVDGKFEGAELTELVFQVLEIVYAGARYVEQTERDKLLSKRERHFIEEYDLVDNGYNKIL